MGETSLLGITFTQLNDVSIVAVVQVPSHPSSYTCTFCLACGVWTSHTHTRIPAFFSFSFLSRPLSWPLPAVLSKWVGTAHPCESEKPFSLELNLTNYIDPEFPPSAPRYFFPLFLCEQLKQQQQQLKQLKQQLQQQTNKQANPSPTHKLTHARPAPGTPWLSRLEARAATSCTSLWCGSARHTQAQPSPTAK